MREADSELDNTLFHNYIHKRITQFIGLNTFLMHKNACANVLKRPMLSVYDHVMRSHFLSSQQYGPI